jgi:hypothetical protein
MTAMREVVTGPGVPTGIGPYSPARMTMQVPLPLGLLFSIGCVAIVESRDDIEEAALSQ